MFCFVQVNGHQISWYNWEFRWSFSPREGLILYNIGFYDKVVSSLISFHFILFHFILVSFISISKFVDEMFVFNKNENFQQQGVLRPILARAALSEMIVPYGYPHAPHFRKNAVRLKNISL